MTGNRRSITAFKSAALASAGLCLAAAGCASPSASAPLGPVVARTEAAGSARFTMGNGRGLVDFRHHDLTISYYKGGRRVMQVIDLGDQEFSLAGVPLLKQMGWQERAISRPLLALQFPLDVLASDAQAVRVGPAHVAGVATTEYKVHVPATELGRLRAAPHWIYVWVDGRGRLRRAVQTVVETSVSGHAGALKVTNSVTFDDFGVPVTLDDFGVPAAMVAPRSCSPACLAWKTSF